MHACVEKYRPWTWRVNFYRDREMRLRDLQLKNALHVHDGAKMNRENGARRQKQGAFSRDEN